MKNTTITLLLSAFLLPLNFIFSQDDFNDNDTDGSLSSFLVLSLMHLQENQ